MVYISLLKMRAASSPFEGLNRNKEVALMRKEMPKRKRKAMRGR